MKKYKLVSWSIFLVSAIVVASACSSTSGSSSSSLVSRVLDYFVTDGSSVTTAYGGTCVQKTRSTVSCQESREALGLSGDWLSFSCNVVLGLADASKNEVTDYASATYVTVTSVDLPPHASNYYPTSSSYSFTAYDYTVEGDYNDLYESYTTTFPNPNTIAQQSIVMYVPINPVSSTHAAMTFGAVGISVDGVAIYNNLASGSDNIYSEAGSFDQCQGHPDSNSRYHYHTEPYTVSYQDSKLIGILRDGYFLYGRYDYGGSTDLDNTNTSSDEYIYGGHVGAAPSTGTGSSFHYHAVYAKGCYHRNVMGTTIYADDGNFTTDGSNPCTGPTAGGTVVEAYFLTGYGNGGAFGTVPTAADNGGTMANSTTAARFYWGSAAGDCTGCQ